jgi:hypothetical protein
VALAIAVAGIGLFCASMVCATEVAIFDALSSGDPPQAALSRAAQVRTMMRLKGNLWGIHIPF